MRKLILSVWVTADGYIVEDGSPAQDFMFAMEDDEEQERWGIQRLADIGEHALGAGTYRSFAQYWPTSDAPHAEHMNRIPKLVFTRSGDVDASWGPVRVITGDVAETLPALKAEDGGEIHVHGGMAFPHSLLRAGLVDEIWALTVPVALGKGVPLFEDLGQLQPLTHVSTTSYSSGLQVVVWKPA